MATILEKQIDQFVKNALKDNWSIIEKLDNSFRLLHPTKFECLIFKHPNFAGPAIIIWGPDKLNVFYPSFGYDFELMKKNIHVCTKCKMHTDKVYKAHVAGRYCKKCFKTYIIENKVEKINKDEVEQ